MPGGSISVPVFVLLPSLWGKGGGKHRDPFGIHTGIHIGSI